MPEEKIRYNKRFSKNNDSMLSGFFRRIEYKKILKLLKPKKGDRILEVGCNSGNFVKRLRKHCGNVKGVDINKDAIADSCVDGLFCMSAEELGFRDGSFSKIVSMHTIEHVPNIEKAFNEMGRVVEKNGRIVVSYPFELVRGLTALPTACFIYKNPLMCRQLHLHKLNLRKMKELIANTNLKIESHKLLFNPWPVYFTVFK